MGKIFETQDENNLFNEYIKLSASIYSEEHLEWLRKTQKFHLPKKLQQNRFFARVEKLIDFDTVRSHYAFIPTSLLVHGIPLGLPKYTRDIRAGAVLAYPEKVTSYWHYGRDAGSSRADFGSFIQHKDVLRLRDQIKKDTRNFGGKARDLEAQTAKLQQRYARIKNITYRTKNGKQKYNFDSGYFETNKHLKYTESLVAPNFILDRSQPLSDISHIIISEEMWGGLSFGNILFATAMQLKLASRGQYVGIAYYDGKTGRQYPLPEYLVYYFQLLSKKFHARQRTGMGSNVSFYEVVRSACLNGLRVDELHQDKFKDIFDVDSYETVLLKFSKNDVLEDLLPYFASEKRYHNLLNKILAKKNDLAVDRKKYKGATAFYYSIQEENYQLALILSEKGASLVDSSDYDKTLTKLLWSKNLKLVEWVVNQLASGMGPYETMLVSFGLYQKITVAKSSSDYVTRKECYNLLENLFNIQKDAVNLPDWSGDCHTLLERAVLNNDYELTLLLVRHNADVSKCFDLAVWQYCDYQDDGVLLSNLIWKGVQNNQIPEDKLYEILTEYHKKAFAQSLIGKLNKNKEALSDEYFVYLFLISAKLNLSKFFTADNLDRLFRCDNLDNVFEKTLLYADENNNQILLQNILQRLNTHKDLKVPLNFDPGFYLGRGAASVLGVVIHQGHKELLDKLLCQEFQNNYNGNNAVGVSLYQGKSVVDQAISKGWYRSAGILCKVSYLFLPLSAKLNLIDCCIIKKEYQAAILIMKGCGFFDGYPGEQERLSKLFVTLLKNQQFEGATVIIRCCAKIDISRYITKKKMLDQIGLLKSDNIDTLLQHLSDLYSEINKSLSPCRYQLLGVVRHLALGALKNSVTNSKDNKKNADLLRTQRQADLFKAHRNTSLFNIKQNMPTTAASHIDAMLAKNKPT